MSGRTPVRRIYISSTYKDLIDERQAAQKAVRAWNHHARGMEDYHASDSRPLDECLADVRNSDAYIGILGWRYGFIPPGQTKSITQLEYEAAGAARLPRLMFLSPEKEQWPKFQDTDAADLKRIEAFRQAAQLEQMAAFFTDAKDLSTAVTLAVGRKFGQAEPFYNLVPYLCNRGPQIVRLARAVKDSAVELREKPFLCILPGAYQQAHEKLIECIKERHIPRWMIGDVSVQSFRIHWPTYASDNFAEDFAFELLNQLPQARSLEDVAKWLSDLRSPVVLYTRLPVEKWDQRARNALDAFVQFWMDWPHGLRCYPVLVILYVEFAANTGWFGNLFRKSTQRNQQIESALSALKKKYGNNSRFILLPALENVEYNDIREWSDSQDVEQICGKGALATAVVEVFDEQVSMPMELLANRLKELLERFHERT